MPSALRLSAASGAMNVAVLILAFVTHGALWAILKSLIAKAVSVKWNDFVSPLPLTNLARVDACLPVRVRTCLRASNQRTQSGVYSQRQTGFAVF
jgi:hypothetical protein